MIFSEFIKIKITNKNIKYYNKKGINCNINDLIDYPVSKLPLGSHNTIDVICDYCGKKYNIKYNNFNIKTKNNILPSCCDNVNCIKQKRSLIIQKKYGVENVFQLETTKNKIKNTNLEKYGVENPQQDINIKYKTEQTNLEKYGVINVFQSEKIKQKIINTNLEKYGVEYASQSEMTKQKTRETNLKNYGVEYPSQNIDFFNKNLKNGFKLTYIDELSCQGSYELDFILKYKDKIKIENGLSIEYYFNNEKKIYHSDFYLPDYNLIVEIKSCYWFNVHKLQCEAKEEYSKKKYNYIMILDKNYSDFDKIINII